MSLPALRRSPKKIGRLEFLSESRVSGILAFKSDSVQCGVGRERTADTLLFLRIWETTAMHGNRSARANSGRVQYRKNYIAFPLTLISHGHSQANVAATMPKAA